MCEGVMLNMLEEWVEGERWSVACEMPSAPYYWTFVTQRHNDTTEIELNYSKSNRCALEPIRKIVLRLEVLDFSDRLLSTRHYTARVSGDKISLLKDCQDEIG